MISGNGADSGNADGKAQDKTARTDPFGAAATAITLSQAHDDAAMTTMRIACQVVVHRRYFIVLVFGHRKVWLAISEECEGDGEFQIGPRHQRCHDAGKGYQQQHGNAAPMIMPTAVAAVQTATGHRESPARCLGQQHVDPDDLADRPARSRRLHVRLDLREKGSRYLRDRRPATASSKPTPWATSRRSTAAVVTKAG